MLARREELVRERCELLREFMDDLAKAGRASDEDEEAIKIQLKWLVRYLEARFLLSLFG